MAPDLYSADLVLGSARLASLVALAAASLLVAACTSDDADAPSHGAAGSLGSTGSVADPNAPDAPQTPAQTDQGCGGLEAPRCDDGKKCSVGKDCKSLSCQQGVCAAPTSTDGVKNLDETDVDCGGATSPRCADGLACVGGPSCMSGVCAAGACKPAAPDDGVKNGDETDVDCGGSAPRCAPGKACAAPVDCESLVCAGNVCQAATASDGVKNGDESDVDCGGTTTSAPRCAVGKACAAHADCGSDGCGYEGKCVLGRSCTQRLGGDTCGVGEVGQAGAVHESCCATSSIAGSARKIDRYHVTAGRMRAFIERLNGNVRGFVQGLPGGAWNQAWNGLVPSTIAEADQMLGSYWTGAPNDTDGAQSKRSCAPGVFGGHTYFTPASGGDYSDFTKDQLDPKALNCVGWHLASAFCRWDGGRIATLGEITSAYTNGGTTTYPWGDAAWNPSGQDGRLAHWYSYGYPNVNGQRRSGSGGALDIAWYVAPPGRHPGGKNASGVSDMAGNMLHWTADGEYLFTWTASWEQHGVNLANTNWKTAWPAEPNGYYAIGFRCSRD